MSYQREPTLTQVKKAVKIARDNTLYFTGCSEYIAKQIRPFAPSIAISNGVPMDTYTFKASVEIDAPLVFLGRIEHIKGPHIAIDVAKKSGRKLIIAGNIPSDTQSQEYFHTSIEPHLNQEQIVYIGPVNDEQKNALLGKAYAFLMPILWNEPFGIVMAEALACGTPVIGFNRGSVPEVIQHGVNGFICEEPTSMTEAIAQVDKLDRNNCRSIAENKFSAEAIVSDYENLYKRVIIKN
jgi:glycosyltransferase involved in cell wall biosynthesis